MRISSLDISGNKARDAARLGIQSAAAAAATIAIMQVTGLEELFLGIISAVFVVQPSVGNTFVEAADRVIATLVGTVIGIVCLFLVPRAFGPAVAVAVSMLLLNVVAGFRPNWRYGVVAAVAIALRSETEALQTAIDRATAIGLGALIGSVASLIVWPEPAQARASRHLSAALRAIASRLDTVVRGAHQEGRPEVKRERRDYHHHMTLARQAAAGIRIADAGPIRDRIDKAERLYNSVLILNRVAERTEQATDPDEQARDPVETIRHMGCEVVTGLADGERDGELAARMECMTEALERAQGSVTNDGTTSDGHLYKNALVFGLAEVTNNLQDLLGSHQE